MKKEEILLELKQLLFAKKLNTQEVKEINKILQTCYEEELRPNKKKIYLINFLYSFGIMTIANIYKTKFFMDRE